LLSNSFFIISVQLTYKNVPALNASITTVKISFTSDKNKPRIVPTGAETAKRQRNKPAYFFEYPVCPMIEPRDTPAAAL
jgi:hypothetical protein